MNEKKIEISKTSLIHSYMFRRNLEQAYYNTFVLIMSKYTIINTERGLLEMDGLSMGSPNLKEICDNMLSPAALSTRDIKRIKGYFPETITTARAMTNNFRNMYEIVD